MARNYLSKAVKQLVRERANGCCEYCLALSAFAFHPFAIEHIIPLIAGGTNELDNLALACQHCNNCKYDKTTAYDPLTHESVPLYHPRQDEWTAHFMWSPDFLTIIGISAIGRTTVDCLKVNRIEGITNIRVKIGGSTLKSHYLYVILLLLGLLKTVSITIRV